MDTELFCRHFAGLRSPVCATCQPSLHTAYWCPNTDLPVPGTSRAFPSTLPAPAQAASFDKLGRPIRYLGKSQICNNFNRGVCNYSPCRLLHACSSCYRAHPKSSCSLKQGKSRWLSHINVAYLQACLTSHPSSSLCMSFWWRVFHTGFINLPSGTFEYANLRSAAADTEAVDALLQSELDKGFVIGPFCIPPFWFWRVSPLGLVKGKFSNKLRLIYDLSAPHCSMVPSLNSLIPSEEFSLKYASVDQAIQQIIRVGEGVWLSKASKKKGEYLGL